MKAGQFRKSLVRVVILQGTAAAALASALVLTVPPSAPVLAQTPPRVEQTRAGDMLYVVDGKVIGQRATLDAAALGVNVGRITVLNPAAARARYGVQGANGAVVIITRRQVQPFNPPVLNRPRAARDTVRTGADPIVVSGVPRDTTGVLARTIVRVDSLGRVVTDSATIVLRALSEQARSEPVIVVDGVRQQRPGPIIIVDGKVVDVSVSDLETIIGRDEIDRIEVIKGEAAVKLYGEAARNGVITIYRKRD
jgi:hypothetical protein